MIAYLETSAVLSWVLQEPDGQAVQASIRQARGLSTSELTLAECWRAMQRLGEPAGGITHQRLTTFQARWDLIPVHYRLLAQVGQPFPVEPVRTLDAIHLVTALDLRTAIPDLLIVALDRRVRENARAYGFAVVP